MKIEQFAITGYLVFYRTYSRQRQESWQDVTKRCVDGLKQTGNLSKEQIKLITQQMMAKQAMPSGRWLWVGGTPWLDKPENVYGGYNCSATEITDWEDFSNLMNIAMMGCGTGSMLELATVAKLPKVYNAISLSIQGNFGDVPKQSRQHATTITLAGGTYIITVGDSRKGWVDGYSTLLHLSSIHHQQAAVNVVVDVSHVRPFGEKLTGFGGVADPAGLIKMFVRVAEILTDIAVNKQGRMTSVDACLLIDEPATAIVAGNVRRTAGMKQGSAEDELFMVAKDSLWQQDADGNWHIDASRAALKMSNHTRVFHHKPTLDECIASVRKQFYSGEGAIQWAGETVMRGLGLHNPEDKALKSDGIVAYESGQIDQWIKANASKLKIDLSDPYHLSRRYLLNPCGEIIGHNFFCNLSEVHLNLINPDDIDSQEKAFQAAALNAVVLLHQKFPDEKYQHSRDIDPIIGVSFTGLFDFFVATFGRKWLEWWQAGRAEKWGGNLAEFFAQDIDFPSNRIVDQSSIFAKPDTDFYQLHVSDLFSEIERLYLSYWKQVVTQTVTEYCKRNNLTVPNRCTTVQPAGTKSLLTGAAPGWHPPKETRYIRRITFAANHPVALAAIECGYGVVPGQHDVSDEGRLLDDPYDVNCKEWLIEVPVKVDWADKAEGINVAQFSALAQFDFYMQVQQNYTGHNTSATIELRESEIEPLANRIYQVIQNDEGYISAALLSRFDDYQAFPRMPFEPISEDEYQARAAKLHDTERFMEILRMIDSGQYISGDGPAPCDSDKCLI